MPTLPQIDDEIGKELLAWMTKQQRAVQWLEISSSINAADPTTQVKAALRRLIAAGHVRSIKGETTTVLYEVVDDNDMPF